MPPFGLATHLRLFIDPDLLAWPASYAGGMEQVPPIEDGRGVDVSQIRRQLRMTVPERVKSMVEAANTMLAIQERARASLRRAR